MGQATQVYLEYGVYIKALKSVRNEQIKAALKTQAIATKNKVTTFSKTQITKFKEKIKDIDLSMKQGFLNAKERVIKGQIKFVEKANRFKKNVVVKVNVTKNRIAKFKKQQIKKFKKRIKTISKRVKATKIKIVKKANRFKKKTVIRVNSIKKKFGKFKKQQIKKFKKRVKNAEKKIKTAKVKIVKKANRFKKNVVIKVKSTKNKVAKFSKKQIKKFKKSIKDIDLSIKQGFLNVKESVIKGQIKFVEKANRFKEKISVKVNSTKNKVAKFSKKQITKFKKTFVSSEQVRAEKQVQINAISQRIEELKKYRNELISSNYQSVSAGRSRGVFYIWMFAIMGVVSMFAIILLKQFIK